MGTDDCAVRCYSSREAGARRGGFKERRAMKTTALLGGALGALVGACIWAAVSWATHLEIGWVAWGIGCLVGAGAVAMGGRGKQAAAVCALLAAV